MRGLSSDEERILRLNCGSEHVTRDDNDADDPVYDALVARGLLYTWTADEVGEGGYMCETIYWETTSLGITLLTALDMLKVSA